MIFRVLKENHSLMLPYQILRKYIESNDLAYKNEFTTDHFKGFSAKKNRAKLLLQLQAQED
jgi:hypothetical protein